MLLELTIKNFAIIEDLRVEFSSGFNVITGETGSGKSIIFDALSVVLGARANKDLIRHGQESAYIEAIFTSYDKNICEIFEKNNIEVGDLIIISREIKNDRPSISKVNGRSVSTTILSKISSGLIDIFAQNESISLMNPKTQKNLIDSFADEDHYNNLNLLEEKFKKLNDLISDYEKKSSSNSDRDREMDLLKYQIDEIEEASLTSSDDEELEDEYKLVSNASAISKNLADSINILKSNYNTESVEDLLDRAISEISQVCESYKDVENDYQELEDIRYRIQDIIRNLENYSDSIEYSPEKLMNLESRINLVNNLKKKYGSSVDDIYKYLDEIKDKYEFLKNYDIEIQKLKAKIDKSRKDCLDLAKIISNKRKEIAKIFSKKIEDELKELNIKDARFEVDFHEKDLSYDGIDDIEFMIITNEGEDFKAMSKIVSGGELSRIMLAFKSIIAKRDNIQTLVFDEIDSGISGITAQIIAKKIRNISENSQVIAISHLPQIVSAADHQYLIEKVKDDKSVISKITKLDNEGRIKELARLIGGMNVTETALKAAEEMLAKKESAGNGK
ncbi:DNA repair protein RecN [Peptoniphilus obesi]|uniref:DNA repair protein RecN n=1 Tax=Peptoniphilus obesi TaxID=1472765 RepID=UPI0004B84BAB|nr:DNA repair protein RecN [Peptoniphilus obesi]